MRRQIISASSITVVDSVVERGDPHSGIVGEDRLGAQRVLAITSSPNWRRPSSAAENDPRPPVCAADHVTPVRAYAALRSHAGAWHCMICWACEANLNPAEDLARLRVLARRLRFSRQHELTRAGRCDRCGGVIRDDVLVREGGK